MIEIVADTGWDKEVRPGASPKGFKYIDEKLLDYKLVAYSGGNTYIYLFASNCWEPFISPEAQIQICGIIGVDNVSVNYYTASMPYFNYLEKHATRSSSIPTSVCIGTWRMAVSLNEETQELRLTKVNNILPQVEGIDNRVGSFCVMPCSYTELPLYWTPGGHARLRRFLSVLFPDPKRFATILWIIANAVLDPGTSSKLLLLYGRGGSGKSTIIRAIETVLKGCCSTIKSTVLTDARDDISVDTAKALASNRVLTAGDINLLTSKLNLHNVKLMTGHDSVSIPPIQVNTRCSVVVGCNDLPDPIAQPSWISSAIQRRLVVVHMCVDTSLIPKREMPDTIEDCQELLMEAIYTKITYPDMPITTEDILYTAIGDRYNYIRERIEILDEVSDEDMFDANTKLDIHMKRQLHELGQYAALTTPDSVKFMGGLNFIKNFKIKDGEELEDL